MDLVVFTNDLLNLTETSGSRLHDINSLLKSLQDRKTKLLCELEDLEAQIQNATVERARVLNESTPIASLPPELLSYVFLICQEQSKSFCVIASHVCSGWRSVAIGSPLLWKDVTFQLKPTEARHASSLDVRYRKLQTYLARTRTSHFNFRLDVNGNHDLLKALDILAVHIWRCSRLSVVIANHPNARHVLQRSLESWVAPNLEYLSIHIRYWMHTHDIDLTQFVVISPVIFTGGAPSLTFVRITGIAGSLQPPLSKVTTLHLDGVYMEPLTTREYCDLLNAVPNLVNLSLQEIGVLEPTGNDSIPPDHSPSIQLPWLRSLRLRPNSASHFSVVNLVGVLPLTSLESLVLSQVEILGSTVFPNVQDLTLNACYFHPTEIINYKLAFPSVIALTAECMPLAIISALVGQEIPLWWPKLKVVSLREMQIIGNPTLLADFVNYRESMGHPLVRIYLDRKSRQTLRRKGVFDDLKALLPVDDDDDMDHWPADLGYEDEDDAF